MAITNLDGVVNGLSVGRRINIIKPTTTARVAGGFTSLAALAGYPPLMATPTSGTGRIPTSSSADAIPFANAVGGEKNYLGRAAVQGTVAGTLVIYDRLWDNSGLVGNITTSQAVNSLPLTRYTDGDGVEIFGQVYTAIGTTASTATVTYTDSNDQTRTATCVMSTAASRVGEMFQFIPQGAAKGVKSIQSFILSSTTGTAGNIGLVLVRRLAEIPMPLIGVVTTADAFALGLPEIQPNAALHLAIVGSTTATAAITGSIDIIVG